MKFLLLFISITSLKMGVTSATTNISEAQNMEIKKTFELLEEGQRTIVLSDQRNLTLIVGNTGSGKTTLIQWLFGDNDELISTPTADGTFYIVDGNRIGHLTVTSKTLFPELVIDGRTKHAYYDCPGFSDTRNTSHDIAITYFIKRVADHAYNIRLVFVVNYSSVRKGVDRLDFMKLLSHATELMNNVEKFGNSVALIGTKVDNLYAENEDGTPELISDEKVISGIAEFLVEVKDALVDDPSKMKFIRLLDIFLTRNDEFDYVRIGIFRRPSRPGALSKIPALRKGKVRAEKIINSISFSAKNDEDFGYTVSDGSKSDISYLIRDIGVTVETNLDKIGKILLENFLDSANSVAAKLSEFVKEDFVNVNANEEIQRMNHVLVLGMREMYSAVGQVKTIKSSSELPEIFRSNLRNLNLDLPIINEILNIIGNQGEYFDFLQLVSKQTFLIPKSWASNVDNSARDLSILNTKFQTFTKSIIEQVVYQVDGLFSSLGQLIYGHHEEIVERMKEKINLHLNKSIENVNILDVTKMKNNLNEVVNVNSNFIQDMQNLKDLTLLYEKVMQSLWNISIHENFSIKLKKFMHFLNNAAEDKMKQSWAISFKNEVTKISNLNKEFVTFVNEMIDKVQDGISDTISRSMLRILENFADTADQINHEINSYINGSLSSSNPFHVQKLVQIFSEGEAALSNLSADSVYISHPIQLAEKMVSLTLILDIHFLDNEIANITRRVNNLDFLFKINDELIFRTPVKWVKVFQAAVNNLTQIRSENNREISNLVVNVKLSINSLIDDVGQSIGQYYAELCQHMEVKISALINGSDVVNATEARVFRDSLILGINITSNLTNYMENLTNLTALADDINRSVDAIKPGLLSAEILKNMDTSFTRLNYLQIAINETKYKRKVERLWIMQLENTTQFLWEVGEDFRTTTRILVARIERTIEDLMGKFSEALTAYFHEQVRGVKINLGYFTARNSTPKEMDVGLSKAKEIAFSLNNALNFTSNIIECVENMRTPLELKSVFQEELTNISGFYISENLIYNISLRTEILDFALTAGNIEFHAPNQWLTPVENAGGNCSVFLENFIKIDVNIACATVYSLIKSDLEDLAENVAKHYERRLLTEDTSDALDTLKHAGNTLTKLIQRNKNPRHVFSYVDNIRDCLSELNVDGEVNNHVFARVSHLEYMRAFSQKEILSVSFLVSFQPFEPLLKFITESRTWFTYLSELDEKLSAYAIQKHARSQQHVTALDDWGKFYQNQSISMDKNNFGKLLDQIKTKREIIFNRTEMTDFRLKALDKVLTLNLRSNFALSCQWSPQRISIRGNFIKFSDFIDERGYVLNICARHSLTIDISANKTLFIDRNLDSTGSDFNLLINAPKWEVIGEDRSIVLDGINAFPIGLHPYRAANGSSAGSRGANGVAGSAGEAARNVTGSGAVFINGNQLRISVNGGKGGRGQHGGHGANGQDGRVVRYEEIDNRDQFWTKPYWLWEKADFLHDRTGKLGLHQRCDGKTTNNDCQRDGGCVCYVYGENGQKGGDGGDGGPGGAGGRAGTVEILERGRSSGISVSKVTGSAGEMGEGGDGGRGGMKQVVKLNYEIFLSFPFFKQRIEFRFLQNLEEFAPNGERGNGYWEPKRSYFG